MAGIYLHIPFCKQRCIYCDFFSTTQEEKQADYVHALCHELEIRKEYLNGESIGTIYLGGGTPSRLGQQELEEIFSCIYKLYKVEADVEITLEANPDDLDPAYIAVLRTLPFNRLSMGVQTFDEKILQFLHRRHTPAQTLRAFHDCRIAGFRNIGIDLMYGLPGETLLLWERDLEQTLALRPEHISAYHLTYEKGTPLWKMREQHKVEEADEETSVSLFDTLVDHLEANGYTHYELSNFCLPDFHSRHNSAYWNGTKYLGCGAAAHSFDGISRQWNIASLGKYMENIEQGTPLYEREELDLYTRYNDFVITRIRTRSGIPLPELRRIFGNGLYDYCLRMASSHLRQGTLETHEKTLRLTRRGLFVSDGIMSDLLWVK